jgi:hypothetical protein
VKFVATRAGSAACAALAARHVPTLLTAVYDPGQAIVAAAAGATYIAPYLGRLNDAGRQGITEVLAMHEVLAATRSTTKVLVASIRTVPDMVALARRGVDCFTMAPALPSSSSPIRPPPRQHAPSRTPSGTPQHKSGALSQTAARSALQLRVCEAAVPRKEASSALVVAGGLQETHPLMADDVLIDLPRETLCLAGLAPAED